MSPHKKISQKDRLIFALDVASKEAAESWLDRLGDHVCFYKVGLQLFLAGWFPVIDMILDRGNRVMVDLKFFDIPETVALAVRELAKHKATFITVHGNDTILQAAVNERGSAGILAVTVLTSFDKSDMEAMGMTCTVEELVYRRAKKALDLGCDGIVSSGLEVPKLRAGLGDQLLIVTPGIRPGDNVREDDQKRVATPYGAIKAGADYLVVGRPIRDAKDPIAQVRSIHNEIDRALQDRSAG
jgi:orotidine-5'-phosphate decarboxylase